MIRRTIRAAVWAAAVLASSVPASAEVRWAEGPFATILEKARKENKHVFVDFYAVWCGPCKMLERTTYRDADVEAFLNGIVSVKYDAEKGEGAELARRFRVSAYPTLVVLGPDGNEVDRHVGYLPPKAFLETIRGYTRGIGTVADYERRLEANPDDPDLLFTLGMKHAEAGRAGRAKAVLGRLLEVDPDNGSGRIPSALYGLAQACYTADDLEAAAAYLQRLAGRFPDSSWYDRAQTFLARVYARMDRPDDALAAQRRYLERHPDDPKAMNAFAWFCAQRRIGLDEALPVALRAVELSGRDPGILDTLAELRFARGEYDEAVKIGEEALSKSPGDDYFKDQLEKFKKARDGADEQAEN